MKYNDAFDLVIGAEGNYTDDPRDNGNWTGGMCGRGELLGTKFGISAKSYGEKLKAKGLSIKDITTEHARNIYKIDFWGALKCDLVPSIHAYPLFSCGVNCGVVAAIKCYQRALGVKDDGVIGKITIRTAIESDKQATLHRFYQEWEKYYKNLVQKNARQAVFLKGWLERIENVKKDNY